jgi:hypothetical protein
MVFANFLYDNNQKAQTTQLFQGSNSGAKVAVVPHRHIVQMNLRIIWFFLIVAILLSKLIFLIPKYQKDMRQEMMRS